MSEAEPRLLRVLAHVRLPERWAALVATLTPRADSAPSGLRLRDVEQMTETLAGRHSPPMILNKLGNAVSS